MNILLSGHSRGLGRAITELLLTQSKDNQVYAFSRQPWPAHQALDYVNLHQARIDLADLETIYAKLDGIIGAVSSLDLVILNAAVLGPVAAMHDTAMSEIESVMKINVWSNKIVLDYLLQQGLKPQQIVLISSGASMKGGFGWSSYALSKATLNMLAKLYSHEFPETHICALAPGIIDTDMQHLIRDDGYVDAIKFTDFQRLRQAKSEGHMPAAEQVAQDILLKLAAMREFESGGYIDIRQL